MAGSVSECQLQCLSAFLPVRPSRFAFLLWVKSNSDSPDQCQLNMRRCASFNYEDTSSIGNHACAGKEKSYLLGMFVSQIGS